MDKTLPVARGVRRAATWPAGTQAGVVRLDHDRRHRRRLRLVTESGWPFLLDLAETTLLAHDDALVLDDGRLIRVVAEPEALLDIHTHDTPSLLRIAWHLGNRHLPVEVAGKHLRVRADHVIEAMVQGLGGHVEVISAVFSPEAGAYAGEGHGHDHAEHDRHSHD